MQLSFKKAAQSVFVCGVILRIALALVNTQSNDDHMSVIKIMAYENRIPEVHEAREAFQPKLYHATVAAVLKIVRPQSGLVETILAQLVGCAAGILTLLLAYRFLMKGVEVSEKVRFISFSLLALNPVLIGINAQATNDSFVILFGSLAFYFGWHFFQNQRTTDFCWMSVSAVLAGLSKGNGLVIFFAIMIVFAIAFYRMGDTHFRRRGTTALYGFTFLVSFLALVPTLGPYWKTYRQYDSPFVTNADPVLLPYWHALPYERESIVDSLFTFPFGDMLSNPQRVNGHGPYPLHQYSGWSQLYGRAHSIHFDAWPPAWQVTTGEWSYAIWARLLVFNITRSILLCALVPTILVLTGLLRSLFSAGRSLTVQVPERRLADWLLDFTTVGYLLFLVALFFKYREAEWFKAIYVFPGFLAFLIFFARECERFYAWCADKKPLRFSVDTIFAGLLVLYVIDVTALLGQLGLGVVYLLLPPDSWNALKNWARGL
jgi:Dolichyl-phosphate-mannose-protein mannosyltransferase